MKPEDFSFLAQMVRRRSGLVLPIHKAPLIEGRLTTVMRRFGFRSVNALIHELRHGRDTLARAVTEAMTTNESSFFRDRPSFDKFREVLLPQLLQERVRSKRLRIWSAACAAGQEPYSIAMTVRETLPDAARHDLYASSRLGECIASKKRFVPTAEAARITRSHQPGIFERYVCPVFQAHPYRCRDCYTRFYSLEVPPQNSAKTAA